MVIACDSALNVSIFWLVVYPTERRFEGLKIFKIES